MLEYDILIVGAGPAGTSAALEASRAGARVLIVERKNSIGHPVQCGEMMPNNLLKDVKTIPRSIIQKIKTSRTYLPNGEWFEHVSDTYMIDRAILDKGLAIQAIKEGAHLMIGTQCVAKEGEKVILRKGNRKISIIPKVIIGADGPKSIVGTWIDSVNTEFYTTLQYEVPLITPSDCAEFYFDQRFFGGYGWLFPKRETANVGLAIRYNQDNHLLGMRTLLDIFVRKLCVDVKIKKYPVSVTGGLIPVGGPLNTLKDNILLVGDAAGQAHPITGGGIGQAYACGKISGEAAVDALKADDLRLLEKYELIWRYMLGKEMKKACKKRKLLESHWNELDSIVKKCWVMFEDYYQKD